MRSAFVLLTLVTPPAPSAAIAAPVEFSCRACSRAAVREGIREGRLQFSVVVVGRTTDVGTLDELVARGPEMVDSQAILRCLKTWQVRGVPAGAKVTVLLNWKWGSWRRISVTCGEITQTVELVGMRVSSPTTSWRGHSTLTVSAPSGWVVWQPCPAASVRYSSLLPYEATYGFRYLAA